MAESQRADWTVTNIWYLALMTFGYIFGEIAHFLINTTSKEVARGKDHQFTFLFAFIGMGLLFEFDHRVFI